MDVQTAGPEKAQSLDELMWAHIARALAAHGGNVSAAARALGMHRRTLQRRIQRHRALHPAAPEIR
jgi:two-component system response regulator RegA